MFIQYDPDNPTHSNLPLFERVMELVDSVYVTTYQPVPESRREEADKIPHFFVVQVVKD